MDSPIVIKAGGYGKRLMPLTANTPKPLLPIGDKPLLGHTLDQIIDNGFQTTYVTTHYLAEQIDILIADYGVVVEAREGRQEIPFPYVLDAGTEFGDVRAIDLARWFPSTELSAIGDEIADGLLTADPSLPHPLSLFDGLRTDFSLARLRHYTGTPPEHVQRYVLFTNYHRYVDQFVRHGIAMLRSGQGYRRLVAPGGVTVEASQADEAALDLNAAARRLVEQKLDQLGLRPGDVDGTFDGRTRRAVRRFQESRGMVPSGYLDQTTTVALLAGAAADLESAWTPVYNAGLLWRLTFAGFAWYVHDISRFSVHGSVSAVVVFLTSLQGRQLVGFGRDAWREVQKVVWPTRKESLQMTAYVFGFVVIMALFLWFTDKTLEWVFYDLILGWKK